MLGVRTQRMLERIFPAALADIRLNGCPACLLVGCESVPALGKIVFIAGVRSENDDRWQRRPFLGDVLGILLDGVRIDLGADLD